VSDVELPAFKIMQHNVPLYITFMTADQLSNEDRIKPDIWSPQNPDGYQRTLQRFRARQFAKFILNERNISPPAVLLSIREPVEFKEVEGCYGYLKIPDNATLWIVDGQHRIEGIRMALRGLRRYGRLDPTELTLPVIIMCPPEMGCEDARYCEAKQFVIINRTQKRVRVDLSDRFIARLTPEQRRELTVLGPEVRLRETQAAVEIADKLNTDPDSPWYQRITIPGQPRRIISQRMFTESLRPILRDPSLSQLSSDEIADLLNEYWKAWQELCPTAFQNPSDYVIQKTTGVFVLHELLPLATSILDSLQRDWTTEDFKWLLGCMDRGNSSEFWHVEGPAGRIGTSKKAFKNLASELKNSLMAGVMRAMMPRQR